MKILSVVAENRREITLCTKSIRYLLTEYSRS